MAITGNNERSLTIFTLANQSGDRDKLLLFII